MNCRYTGLSFTNKDFTHKYNLLQYILKPPKTIQILDIYAISCSNIAKYLYIDCTIRYSEVGQSQDCSRVNHNSKDRGWDRDKDRDSDEGRGEDIEVPYFLLIEFTFFGF
jgi:hypothetical protein